MNIRPFLTLFFGITLSACHASEEKPKNPENKEEVAPIDEAFKEYWFSGKAELSRYKLEQRRYGEIREGDVVTVFVTEPFLKESQVKKERKSDEPSTQVLKLNLVKEFTTGIYDYDMMTSVFHPVERHEFQHPIKTTTTSQEWCGQSFLQLNNREDEYELQGFSYFQDEGDVERSLDKVILEDELWTRVRLSPESLPTGEMELLPSGMDLRLLHLELEPVKAEAEFFEPEERDSIYPGEGLQGYRIQLKEPDRKLRILYEGESPYRIAGWEEWTGNGEEKELRVRAVRTHQLRSAYWEQNGKKHHELRKKLGLGE